MKILVSTSRFGDHDLPENVTVKKNPFEKRLDADEISKLLDIHKPDALIAGLEPLNAAVLEGRPWLKVISRCGTGMDNVDLETAERLGIKVFNTPDAPSGAVAEMTLALILSLVKKIGTYDKSIRSGVWECPSGSMLSGKTAGIIGFGRIGKRVGAMLDSLGCRVIFYNRSPIESDFARQTGFEELIEQSDIISLHIPYTDESRHMMAKEQLEKMKKDAFLVNTARGGLIEEDDLLEALRTGELAGAALDCFETEPYDGPLLLCENTVLTPHKGSSAVESRIKMEREALDNVLKFFNLR